MFGAIYYFCIFVILKYNTKEYLDEMNCSYIYQSYQLLYLCWLM